MVTTAALALDPGPPWWSALTTWAECRRLLPGHDWLGEQGSHLRVSRGDIWIVLADVLAQRVGHNDRGPQAYDIFKVDRLARATSADHQRNQIGSSRAVVRAGTTLRVAEIGGYADWGCAWPGVGAHLQFELPGGSVQIILETHEANADTRDIDGPWTDVVRWCDIMAAAVIVPVAHPFARNHGLVAEALERIDAAYACGAHSASPGEVCESEFPPAGQHAAAARPPASDAVS